MSKATWTMVDDYLYESTDGERIQIESIQQLPGGGYAYGVWVYRDKSGSLIGWDRYRVKDTERSVIDE